MLLNKVQASQHSKRWSAAGVYQWNVGIDPFCIDPSGGDNNSMLQNVYLDGAINGSLFAPTCAVDFTLYSRGKNKKRFRGGTAHTRFQ